MKKKFLTILIAAVMAIAALSFAACKSDDNGNPADTSFTITDFDGSAISFDKPAGRVISFGAADTPIIIGLGAADKLVAKTMWDTEPELDALQSVDSFDINVEAVLAFEPEVIFTPPNSGAADQFDQLKQAGIKIIVLNAAVIADIYRKIDIISEVLGAADKERK